MLSIGRHVKFDAHGILTPASKNLSPTCLCEYPLGVFTLGDARSFLALT